MTRKPETSLMLNEVVLAFPPEKVGRNKEDVSVRWAANAIGRNRENLWKKAITIQLENLEYEPKKCHNCKTPKPDKNGTKFV